MRKNILMIGSQREADSELVKNYRLYKNKSFWVTLVQDLAHAKKCFNYSRQFEVPEEKYKLLLFTPFFTQYSRDKLDDAQSFLMSARKYVPVGMWYPDPENIKHYEKGVHYDGAFYLNSTNNPFRFDSLESSIHFLLNTWEPVREIKK
jgi:hypothetical protein